MARAQHLLLPYAERLTTDLRGAAPGVKKNVLLAVVSGFQSERRPDVGRLQRLLALLEKGSGGHLRRGGESYGDQLRAVVHCVRALLLEGTLEPAELKTVFGWTARLLLVREDRGRRGGVKPPGGPGVGVLRPPAVQPGLATVRLPPPPQTPVPPPKPAIRKGDRIEALVRKLEGGVYTLYLPATEQELKVRDKGYPWGEGSKLKVRVIRVAGNGLVQEVAP